MADRPDIAHIQYEINTFGPFYTNLLFPMLLLLLMIGRPKVIVTMHSVFANVEDDDLPSGFGILSLPLVRFFLFFFYNLVSMLADGIIVHSRIFRNSLTADYGLAGCRLHVIPHGVGNTKPKVDQFRLRYWGDNLSNRRVILFFGVLSPRKGIDILIKSYASIQASCPESFLVIAGKEPSYYRGYRRTLEDLTRALGMTHRVLFTGFVEGEDIGPLFSIAEIVVFPYIYSISASGTLSTAIQYLKPIIASRTDYVKGVLTDQVDAVLVSPGNIEDLSTAINGMLEDPSLREKLSKNLENKANKYSWKKIAEATSNLYADVLSRKRRENIV